MAAAAHPLVVAYNNALPGAPRDQVINLMINTINQGPYWIPMAQLNHICIRLIVHGNTLGPSILLNNVIDALISVGNPTGAVAMPFGNAHAAITAFLVRQSAVYALPGPRRDTVFRGLLQELRLTEPDPNQPNAPVYNILASPAYMMALQSVIQESNPAVPNQPGLHLRLIDFLIRTLRVRMDRPGATWDSIANALSLQANFQPWAYTALLHRVVRALLHYSDLEYVAHVHTPNNVIMCLIQQAGQYPADHRRRELTDSLLKQTRLPNCPLKNNIMRALTLLVRTVPPTNIVDHKSMNSLWRDEKTLLNEFLRLQGITVAPPNVPPGLAGVPGGPGGQWTLCYSLGSGGEGIAYLYAYIDGTRTIRDRFVQRNVISDWTFWNRIERWYLGQIGGTPNEAWLMNMFNSQNVVGYRSHSVNANNWIYTTYIDYVEHGSLSELIHSHRGQPIKPFDESFLWHLFRSLARGLRDMQAALPAPVPGGPVSNVVHGDLHCGNVFLGREDNAVFRLYPTPKIADFGSAQMTNQFDVNNPWKFYAGFHKHLFDPPELMRGIGGFTHNPGNIRVMQSANIYQIGVIMLCAMRLQTSPRPAISNPPNVDAVPPRGLVRGHSTAGYSAGLKNLVHACLSFNAAGRPSPTTLLAHITIQGAAFFGPNTLEGWQAHPARKPTTHRHKLLVTMSDTYRVGLRLARNPQRPRRTLRGRRR